MFRLNARLISWKDEILTHKFFVCIFNHQPEGCFKPLKCNHQELAEKGTAEATK